MVHLVRRSSTRTHLMFSRKAGLPTLDVFALYMICLFALVSRLFRHTPIPFSFPVPVQVTLKRVSDFRQLL